MNATSTGHVWGSPETLGDEPRPSAEENCADVRARMAREGLDVTQEPMTLTDSIAWLRSRSWSWHEVLEAMALLLSRPGRSVLCGPGWRLFLSCRRGSYTLLQTGRA